MRWSLPLGCFRKILLTCNISVVVFEAPDLKLSIPLVLFDLANSPSRHNPSDFRYDPDQSSKALSLCSGIAIPNLSIRFKKRMHKLIFCYKLEQPI